MAIQIKCMKLPYEKRGKVFSMILPLDSSINRAGISPADGEPSIWFTVHPDNKDIDEDRRFVIVTDDEMVDDNNAMHRGIWWEGNYAFHLFEMSGL